MLSEPNSSLYKHFKLIDKNSRGTLRHLSGSSMRESAGLHRNNPHPGLFYIIWGRRGIGTSGFLIWSETLMGLIFNPCGEFRWSQDGPVSQIHFPHLHVGASGIFSDLLESVQMLKTEWVRKAMGSYCNYLSLVKLQSWFLNLGRKTCLWTELQL